MGAAFGDPAQDGVGEAIEMGGFRAQAREFDGVGDGGVRRDGEDRQFSGACQQNKANANGIRRQGLFEELADDDLAGITLEDGEIITPDGNEGYDPYGRS